METVITTSKNWQQLLNLTIYVAYDPSILLLGIDHTEMHAYVHHRACKGMFIAIKAAIWKPLKCPLIENGPISYGIFIPWKTIQQRDFAAVSKQQDGLIS